MKKLQKKIIRATPPAEAARMVETIYGCKWSLTIYHLLANGINRPGEIVRNVDGLTTKVLNDCLKRNIGFGLLERISYNEIPLRVEYRFTALGVKFTEILAELEKLQLEIEKDGV